MQSTNKTLLETSNEALEQLKKIREIVEQMYQLNIEVSKFVERMERK